MRMAVAATALGLTLLAAGALAACSPDDPVEPPDPVPSRTPVFASEEEALAAAEAAYAAYLEVANAVAKEGGAQPERFADVTTAEWLEKEISSAEALQATGNVQVGDVTFAAFSLQYADVHGETAELGAYACLDLTEARFVDSAGTDVTSGDRDPVVPIEVLLVSGPINPSHLVIASNEPWTGQDFC
jgi:hypothetical protein